MTKTLETAEPPLVAFIGESQVGKSSLINALAGARLLPTTGTGAPRSQAVCEWRVLPTPMADANWRVSAEWLPRDAIAAMVESKDAARGSLLREGIDLGQEPALHRALRNLSGAAAQLDIFTWAAGRDTAWLPLDIARREREARHQVEMLAARWPAALASRVQICGEHGAQLCLVDLPGLGHDDVGGHASAIWLTENASRVAAIFCVVGKRTPEVLEGVLRQHWATNELQERLHVVATFADQLVEDHTSESDRRRAAESRRQRASEHLCSLVRGTLDSTSALQRTFCLDPRPDSRFWQKIEFDGELDRLRRALAAIRPPPPRPAVALVRSSPPQSPAIATARFVSPRREEVPMALQPGETLGSWLSRLVIPVLRQGRWEPEPLRSGLRRLHLKATDSHGREITFVTIYGTGEAYCITSTRKIRLAPPITRMAGEQLLGELLDATRRLGVMVSDFNAQYNRRAL